MRPIKFVYWNVALLCTLFAAVSFVGFVCSVITWDVESASITGMTAGFFFFMMAVMAKIIEE